jgi:phytoene dehydrogenase-like protein
MKYDIIIVGAGLGGLTAGAKLTREGKKVLVIEQHSKPGGCATTFRRGDFTMEVGLSGFRNFIVLSMAGSTWCCLMILLKQQGF